MVLRKRTILADVTWKTVPWKDSPKSKSLAECLTDVIAGCTHILVMQDLLAAANSPTERRNLALKLYADLQLMLDQLKAWKVQWDTAERDYAVEVNVMNGGLAASSFPSPRSRLWYKSFQHANVTSLYNATVILVEDALDRLKASGLISYLDNDSHTFRIHIAALDICRSIDYCLQNASERLENFHIIFPIRMAWHALFHVEPDMADWLEKILEQIRNVVPGHWGVAAYVLKVGSSPRIHNSKSEDLCVV